MPTKKVTKPTPTTQIKKTSDVTIKGLRIDIGGNSMYGANTKLNINVDEINGESESVNSFLTEVRTICKELK